MVVAAVVLPVVLVMLVSVLLVLLLIWYWCLAGMWGWCWVGRGGQRQSQWMALRNTKVVGTTATIQLMAPMDNRGTAESQFGYRTARCVRVAAPSAGGLSAVRWVQCRHQSPPVTEGRPSSRRLCADGCGGIWQLGWACG